MASAMSSRSRPAGHFGVFPVNAMAGTGGSDGGVQLADKLKIIKTDNFDPDAYVQSKCRAMDEKFKVSGDLYMMVCYMKLSCTCMNHIQDYDIGDKIILHVVLWFTGEAAQHEESEVMDGEDDDDEDDDDEDDDDYDTKKNKGTAGGEGQQGKRPTKCKQQ
uniref:Uncharacterized protein n=1 Tax=Zea mays TaxID=4577 RepID=A0A804LP34_MAIZE